MTDKDIYIWYISEQSSDVIIKDTQLTSCSNSSIFIELDDYLGQIKVGNCLLEQCKYFNGAGIYL